MDRSTEIAITLIRMALALLDKAERPERDERVQQAIDLAQSVTEPAAPEPTRNG